MQTIENSLPAKHVANMVAATMHGLWPRELNVWIECHRLDSKDHKNVLSVSEIAYPRVRRRGAVCRHINPGIDKRGEGKQGHEWCSDSENSKEHWLSDGVEGGGRVWAKRAHRTAPLKAIISLTEPCTM